MKTHFFSLFGTLLMVSNLSAATFYVAPGSLNPTPPYNTWATAAGDIQAAVNAAGTGDLVLVTNGYYPGAVSVGKPLSLQSINGAQFTFIDGNRSSQCVALSDGASLSGFTLTNGFAENGGGLWCNSTNAYVTNCIMSGNLATNGGGAYGGTLYNCLIVGNSTAGAQYGLGGGTYESTLYNCTVVGNSANGFGGTWRGTIYNSIIYNNTAQYYSNFWDGQFLYNCCTAPLPTNGVGNITNAPLFVNQAGGIYQLQPGSPCIDAGNNSFVANAIDLAGDPRIIAGTVDMGAYEFLAAGPPRITAQPQEQTIYAGANVAFSAAAQGSVPLTWHWLFNGTPIGGATDSSLSLVSPVTTNQAGGYSVVVTNSQGAVTSQVAVLTVIDASPSITLQPSGRVVNQGTNVTLTAKAVGSLPLNWQWLFNGAPLASATNPNLPLTAVTTDQSGGYSVVVSNYLGSITSQVALLTVSATPVSPPQIVQQPYYMRVYAGSNFNFQVQATGSQPLFFQWMFDGAPIKDATNAIYNIPGAMPSQEGDYSVVITNYVGSITSRVVSLIVDGGPPVITQQPPSQTTYAGTTVSFTVSTSSQLPPLSWQWLFKGAAIASATDSTLILPGVQSSQAGGYSVVITNFLGSVTSQVAVLTVLDAAPSITLQPVGQTLYAGNDVFFKAAAVGSVPFSWQWFFNQTPIPGASLSNLLLSAVKPGQAGNYSVVVSNNIGSATSQVAVLVVQDAAPSFTLQPVSQTVFQGTNVTFSALATGSLPLSWQWLFNGAPIPSATFSNLTLFSVTPAQSGTYSVIASNALGAVPSANAILTVKLPGISYVWQDSPNPTAPYTNWATAAHDLQDAVDAAGPGDQIVVTNGIYATGGRTVGTSGLTNRVAVEKPLTIRSVNGPDVTVIQGYQMPDTTNGAAAIRCVYLGGSNSVLIGFTLTNGATLITPPPGGYADANGGAVYSESWDNELVSCKVMGNSAANFGGGAYVCSLFDCLVVGNTSFDTGGGTCFCNLTNCTITGNTASRGGGAVVGGLYNCILYYNTSGWSYEANWLPDKGGFMTFCCSTPVPFAVEWHNIDGEPLFVDPANGDYHLQPNSPCINAGNNYDLANTTDLDGNPRIIGGTIDIGAYEYQRSVPTIPLAWLQQYGLPTDGSADLLDPDGDGMNNWQEWVAGTSPTNAQSNFHLLSVVPTSTDVTISWQSVAGVNYFVVRCADLTWPANPGGTNTNFVVVATNIVGQAGATSFTDTNSVDTGPFLYRIGVAAP